ncbi:hypothetical protein COCOR_04682 [Corallococcus coralloides DSM 2259]|uniref:Uncharacterized protein n=1 Tax=Corallococcus coralloides (strain ATCC 25202 / DSM 2259 / NBRC 100086 / M2) TaxID=1144275 RepID=H8MJF2_CORCM|nr:hypothetical protein COCOR_04682 [Corallococcus coralloides DSM 2259]
MPPARRAASRTRLGGDRLRDLVRLTTGHDLLDMTLPWAMGTLKPLEADPVPRHPLFPGVIPQSTLEGHTGSTRRSFTVA